jgi:hypothetical protein
VVDDILAQNSLPRPRGRRRPSPESRAAADALADAIAAKVDHLMAVRWSRSQGMILEPEAPTATVSTSACACGSGIPVTTVELDGRTVQIIALEPILEMAHAHGLRADGFLPAQIMETVRVYNAIPDTEEALWQRAVNAAWQSYCGKKEADRG